MPADGAGQDAALYFAAQAHEVFDGVTVGNVGHVLVEYRPGI